MRFLSVLITFTVYQISFAQQGLYITDGSHMKFENNIITIQNGDFVSQSNSILNGGTLRMTGLNAQTHYILLQNEYNLENLELYGNSTVEFEGLLNLNNELRILGNSNLNLNTNSHIILGETANIIGESNISTISGADGSYLFTTRNHTAGVTNNFGNIGVEVSNGTTSMGNTEIFRRYGSFNIDGNTTVSRYYEINPTINLDLNLDTRFYLYDDDLNGLERSNLVALRSNDNGTTFTNEGGFPSTYYHLVENINAFSLWTFADAATLNIDNSRNNSIALFPNPASSIVNITSNNRTQITSIELYNISGQKIEAHLSDDDSIDVRNLSDGVYFLHLTSENETLIKKLVVKR